MNKYIFNAFLVACSVVIVSEAVVLRMDAQEIQEQKEMQQASWSAFCEEFGYDERDTDSQEAIDKYLDCWCGSVAEDAALDSI